MTVKELIEELKKHPEDKEVTMQMIGIVGQKVRSPINELEIEEKKLILKGGKMIYS